MANCKTKCIYCESRNLTESVVRDWEYGDIHTMTCDDCNESYDISYDDESDEYEYEDE